MDENGDNVSTGSLPSSTCHPRFPASIESVSRADRFIFHIGTLANMQVITAIYLNCRPDLRDEWLSGNEVDDLAEGQVTIGSRTIFLNRTHGAARDKNMRLDTLSNSVSFISMVECQWQ